MKLLSDSNVPYTDYVRPLFDSLYISECKHLEYVDARKVSKEAKFGGQRQ